MKPQPEAAATGTGLPEFFSLQVSEERRFYLDLNPPRGRPLSVVCGGLEHTTPDYSIRRQGFPFYCIEYVGRGQGRLKLGRRSYSLQPGRVFGYGPTVPHEITSDPGAPLVKYFVNFTGRRGPELLRSCGLGPHGVLQCFPPNELQPIFDELIHCGQRRGARHRELCAGLLDCLALKIAGCRVPPNELETLAFRTYQRCRLHIQEHFRRLRSLDQISRECRVNNAYLCRLFRRYEHQSPYQYLLRLKMNLAADLIQNPSALVKQVTEEVGFTDPFHFSRAFKSVFGMSPDRFRKWR
ncbi:MAG: AraC family transcriptional regulator [Verrucomicrobiota bacterium]